MIACRVNKRTWSSPALVLNQTTSSCGNATSKKSRSLPISNANTASGCMYSGASLQQMRDKTHAIWATIQG